MPAVLEHLRAHRAGADVPREYLTRLGSRDRRRAVTTRGLSQNMVATMAGVDVRTYGAFERQGDASASVVRAVAGILGASRAQQVAMWRWIRRPAPEDLQPPAGRLGDLADQLTSPTPSPAVWLSPDWDIVGANTTAAEHLGVLARLGDNWATAILGPRAEARDLVADWPGCAQWMVAALRMATVDPARSCRLAEVACEVRQHPPTAALWDASADMLEGPDGMTLRAHLPSLSPRPVELRLSTLSRGPINLVVLRPVTNARRPAGTADGPAREEQ